MPTVHPPTARRAALAPLCIALPHGLNVSGVTLWAVRLAGALAEQGRAVTLLRHAEPAGQGRLDLPIHRAVRVVDLSGLPPLHEAAGDLAPWIPHYRGAIRDAADRHGAPVVVSPNLLGDCYGLAAALCLTDPEMVRVVGWQHSDIEYDARVLLRYEPVVARFVGVSDAICGRLRERLAHRAGHVIDIPYGVPVPPEAPAREHGRGLGTTRPLRLLYTGRLEHQQKRILALVHLSDALDARGVRHELTLLGDGPASAEIDALAATRGGRLRRLAPASPAGVSAVLDRSDALVLASRYEGLSVSMLEAMARGCVPIVTRAASGTAQAIDSGVNGEIAEAGPGADEREAGESLADAVQTYLRRDARQMSVAAWETARGRFSLESHADAASEMLDAAASDRPRPWPADRACAFSGSGAGGKGQDGVASGSVPADGAARLRALLASLAGRRVLIHGAGRHTVELGHVLAASPALIVGIADDDRGRHGGALWGWPIVAPERAGETGATDAVISSWMHQDAIWARRGVYERLGIAVHRIYDPS